MILDIQRQKPVVEAYHYDKAQPEQEGETQIQVGLSPLSTDDPNYPKTNSIVGARLQFRLLFPDYVLAGSVSQINHLIDREVRQQEDLTKEEVDELVAPLFDMVKRLTYEVTEIAMDEPGLTLNFQDGSQEGAE